MGLGGTRQLTIPRTTVGRQLAKRRHGVRTIVDFHFRKGQDLMPGDFAWMIRLKN